MNGLDKKKFGERLKGVLKEKGVKQKELAAHLHTTEKAVSDWVKGRKAPHYYNLDYIADYLDVNIKYLTGRTDSSTNWGKYEVEHPEQIEQIRAGLKLIDYIESFGYDLNHLSEDEYVQLEKEINEFIEFKLIKLGIGKSIERKGSK